MTTQLAYFDDTDKIRDISLIVASKKDEYGPYLLLKRTIFYPQGGGQPCDQGTLGVGAHIVPVHSVRYLHHEVRHYTNQDHSLLVAQEAVCILDAQKRVLHSKLHTAGHLISNVVESLYPQWRALKGHHFPGQCYVEFSAKNEILTEIFPETIQAETKRFIETDCLISAAYLEKEQGRNTCPNLACRAAPDQDTRVIRIGDFPFSPCGGTHIKSLSALQGLKVIKVKIKKDLMKISHTL